jgi:soluble lytic murein transglycosylase
MQITDKTGEYIANLLDKKDYDLFNAKDNLNFGCYYINKLIGQFNSVETAMIAFNAGEGNVRKWLKNSEYSVDGVTLNNVPFNETKEYIKKIKQNFTKYKKLYRNILDKR